MSVWNDEMAQWYVDRYGEWVTNRLAIEALALSSANLMVDVGCGTGCALRHAASRDFTGRLIGVDPVSRMINVARERASQHPQGERIEFRQGKAEALPVDDDSADYVLALDSLDHWEDRTQGLREVRRILKVTGLFVVGKDETVSGIRESSLIDELAGEGFAISKKLHFKEEVSFAMWICTIDFSLIHYLGSICSMIW